MGLPLNSAWSEQRGGHRVEQERRRWAPFRRALSAEDQAVFDRLFACITRHVPGDVYLSRPWSFEAVILAVQTSPTLILVANSWEGMPTGMGDLLWLDISMAVVSLEDG